jgi:hypothetical protein
MSARETGADAALSDAELRALFHIGNEQYDRVRSGCHLAKLEARRMIARTGEHGRYQLTEFTRYWMLGHTAEIGLAFSHDKLKE